MQAKQNGSFSHFDVGGRQLMNRIDRRIGPLISSLVVTNGHLGAISS
jgi:hypothetical protein